MKKVFLIAAYIALALASDLALTEELHAQDVVTAMQAQAASASVPEGAAPAIVAPVQQAPIAVVVPAPAAPPQWATDLLLTVSKLPLIGPYVSKALLYLGILAAILTSLVAAALSILASLHGAFNAAGLDKAAQAIEVFKDSKFMYWLVYFSNFNAKKPVA